jgi:glycosyltransferase involved in cell wall biosynthesis
VKIKQPLVTIICPLFNKQNFIVQTIESVLNQTYLNWELIIVDDGSNDNSISLVKKYVGENIYLFERQAYEKSKKGGSVCRNIGLKKAKGQYIIFLDADDILVSNCLEKRLELATKNETTDVLIFGFQKFKFNTSNLIKDQFSFIYEKFRYKLTRDKREFMLKRFLLTDYFWQTSSAFWKKDAILKLGGFTESFLRFQDPELHIRAILDESIKIKVLKYEVAPDFYYRIEDSRERLNVVEKYKRLVDHLKHFIFFINEVLENSSRTDLLKYLGAYLLLVEVDKPIGENENRVEIERIYKDFYDDIPSNKYFNFKLKFYKQIFKTLNLLRLKFLKKVLYWFFKITN